MTFNAEKHLTDLRGKKYLETKWRLVWFREDHPRGQVGTEIINFEPLVVRATVCDENGVILATGHGSAKEKSGAVWSGREIEKAETAAIGRALAHAGYGTQFTEDSDTDNLADSPVERPKQRSMSQTAPQRPAPSDDDAFDMARLIAATAKYDMGRAEIGEALKQAAAYKVTKPSDWQGGHKRALAACIAKKAGYAVSLIDTVEPGLEEGLRKLVQEIIDWYKFNTLEQAS